MGLARVANLFTTPDQPQPPSHVGAIETATETMAEADIDDEAARPPYLHVRPRAWTAPTPTPH
jgi:hypothetical protein